MDCLTVTPLEDGILELRLNRPDRFNALDATLIRRLVEIFESLNHDRSTRAVILAAAGKGFCAGADLRASASPGDIPGTQGMGTLGFVYKYQEYLGRMILAVHECDKPVIAALNGAAVGGGMALALACDIRVGSTAARLGDGVVQTGLSGCDVGISYLLPRIVGAGVAAELMLTGRIVDAAEAHALKLLSAVAEPDALDTCALGMARRIAAHAEYAVWMTKKTLRSSLDAPSLRHAIEMENRTQVLGTFTGGMDAMREAFASGGAPRWKPL